MHDREVSSIYLPAIVRAAKAATPGPWHSDVPTEDYAMLTPERLSYEPLTIVRETETSRVVARTSYARRHDAAFIAAANPQTVLAMARRIEELEAQIIELLRPIPEGYAGYLDIVGGIIAAVETEPGMKLARLMLCHEQTMKVAQERAEQAEQRALDAERLAVALVDMIGIPLTDQQWLRFSTACEQLNLLGDWREQIDAIRARLAGKEGGK